VLSETLKSVYTNIDDVDPWIGFMSEDHFANSIVGEGLSEMLRLQFEFLRDGDRYYYENDPAFTTDEIEMIKSTTLSKILLRNTEILTLQENVFIAEPRGSLGVELFPFSEIKTIRIKAYPNPIQKYFNLRIETHRPTSATLSIYNVTGALVRSEKVQLKRGQNELNFELSDALANGLYVIALTSDSGNGQLKVIKQ
jgi:hypothetical protein